MISIRGHVLLLALLVANTARALEASPPVVASVSLSGEASRGPCVGGTLSVTGRYLAFTCASSDLVTDDRNARNDAFLVDRVAGVAERVSLDSAEQEHRFDSYGGYPSADGRFVAFDSYAPLHPDLTFPYIGMGHLNPFLRDRGAGTTDLLGRSASGYVAPRMSAQLLGVSYPTQKALFSSQFNLLTSAPPPPPPPTQLYVRNWTSGAIELVTATPAGSFSTLGGTGSASLSQDGRFVAFISDASDLGANNPSATPQLMLRDMQTRSTKRLSYTASGGEFAGPPYYQARAGNFSWDASLLAIDADSDELVGNGAIGRSDTYVVHAQTGFYELISTGFGGVRPDNGSYWPDISGDGRYVVFASRASNLLATPQLPGVYVKDRWTGELINISATLGAPGFQHISHTSISADGLTVAFDWRFADDYPLLGGRSLIYTVQLRGTPASTPVAVPALRGVALWALIGLFLLLGLRVRSTLSPRCQ
jgi:Tol biopolymer transport system component